jgi:hypothetical protein
LPHVDVGAFVVEVFLVSADFRDFGDGGVALVDDGLRRVRGTQAFIIVILRCERSEPRRMLAEAPGPSPFDGRCAATSG